MTPALLHSVLATVAVVRLLDPSGLNTVCGLLPFGRHLRRGLALRPVAP